MKPNTNNQMSRQYYIDWLRILLISSVFLFHTGMIFVKWNWHVKNDVLYGGLLAYLLSFLHSWRMPLLFLISGAGTYYALRALTPSGYVAERTKRLLVPLAAGIFILVPVQVYIEKIGSYNSLISYYPHMFEGVYPSGNFSWHHLWFIAYLYVIALIISPFLNFLRSARFSRVAGRMTRILIRPLGMNLILIPLLLSQIILRNYFETETNALFNDWASITFYLIFFLAGFIFIARQEVADALAGYRKIYLAETVLFTLIMYMVPGLTGSERTGEIIYDVSEVIISWTCSVAAIGYARRYLNFDSSFRKNANEAIYPFYLLHQPLIVVTGYLITGLDINDLLKALLIMGFSFVLFILSYRFLIRPYSIFRVIFGMKMTRGNMKTISLSVNHVSFGKEAERA
jgi:glucan biosynthesis protein C